VFLTRKRAYARAGLLGNPSDGYGGAVLAVCARSFAATVELVPAEVGTAGDPYAVLFGERPGGFVVSGPAGALEALGAGGVPVQVMGEVGGDVLTIAVGEELVTVPLQRLAEAHDGLSALFP